MRAFTLVEVMVTVAVFGALVTVLHSFMRFSIGTQRRLTRRGAAMDEAHKGLIQLIERLQRSPYVEVPASGDLAEEVVFQDGRRATWVVAARGNDLVMEEKFGTRKSTLALGLKSLKVYRQYKDLLLVELHIAAGREEFSLTTAVYLRRCHVEPLAAAVGGS